MTKQEIAVLELLLQVYPDAFMQLPAKLTAEFLKKREESILEQADNIRAPFERFRKPVR